VDGNYRQIVRSGTVIEEPPDLSGLRLEGQGKYKRVLFVCSGGMQRSATAAHWSACVKRWNTRSCGTREDALPPVHRNLIEWADKIYCMEKEHLKVLWSRFPWARKKLHVLDIPDEFDYREEALIDLLTEKIGGGT